MIKIAILDDEEIYLNKERSITEKYFAEKGIVCNIETFQNPLWLLSGIKEEVYDVYILDVDMPNESGIEVAKKIRKLYPDPVVIFATNFMDYAVEAYEVNTYRYIAKAALEEKLPGAYNAMLPQILEKEERYYIIEKKNNIEKIDYTDIYHLKKEGKYVVFFHKRGESRVRKSLAQVYQELDAREFLIIDKSYVVNIKHVMKLKNGELHMRNGTILPVGNPRVNNVKKAILEFWR